MHTEAKKIITNPASGERVTFITTSSETNGLKTVIEIELKPGGEGPPPHYHNAYAETFEVFEGELSLQMGKEMIVAHKGKKHTINKHQLHTFRNDASTPARFQVTVTPGHEGFENGITILFGLSRDGLVTKNGAPKSLVDLLVVSKLSDSRIAGLLSFIPPILNLLISNKKLERRKNELISKYCDGGVE